MKNKKVVITGGSRGIGKAIAMKFSTENYDVAICSRNEHHLEDVKQQIEQISSSRNHIFAKTDIRSKSDILTFSERIKSAWSSIDVLINNAGVFEPGLVTQEEDGVLEKLIETNLYSAYHITRALLPQLLINEHAHIYNICSVASLIAYPNGGSYSISKFALLGFSKALREELKEKNVKVTAVLPGATLTDSWAGVDLPTSRFIKAEDIAQVIFNSTTLSENTVIEEILIRPQLGDL